MKLIGYMTRELAIRRLTYKGKARCDPSTVTDDLSEQVLTLELGLKPGDKVCVANDEENARTGICSSPE